MSVLQTGLATPATGYTIDNSLRFNDDDSAYLSRTPSSAGNRKTWTWSGWVKRGNLESAGGQQLFGYINASNTERGDLFFYNDTIYLYFKNSDVSVGYIRTSQLLRDPSAWYHIVVTTDTTQATTSDRLKIYVNGIEATLQTAVYPSQNTDLWVNNIVAHRIGKSDASATYYLDGYLAEVNFIDGQALTPADFGETGDYGEWKPIEYTGTYGTNGFYLDFGNSGSLGTDSSGNSNNWTPNNLAATDQMLDSPTNNFCTLNPLDTIGAASILLEGNLEHTSTASSWGSKAATFGMSSGKWYWEYVITASGAGPNGGIVTEEITDGGLVGTGGVFTTDGGLIYNESSSGSSGAQTYSIGDIISLTYDADSGELKHSINNSSFTSVVTGKSGREWFPVSKVHQSGDSISHNFGQDSSFAGNKTAQGNTDGNGIGDFYYTPPTGYLALCTQNLPDPAVIPSEHFSALPYIGTGTSSSVTGVGFQPDLLWIKRRNYALDHQIYDAVRGVGNGKLSSNTTSTEEYDANGLSSFDSDGWSMGIRGHINTSGGTYVAWNWKANGTGVSNTDGTITSTVSANADAGFSIVSWDSNGSNATIGHGLSKAPEMIILKEREESDPWHTYHETLGNTAAVYLNSTGAVDSGYAQFWNNTSPTSTVFTVSSGWTNNDADGSSIAYCFHSVDGFSKVGSYTGNGSSDGTFVYTGFRPAYVMVKRTDAADNWHVNDAARSPNNPVDDLLHPDSSSVESANGDQTIDILSNGFKSRDNHIEINTSGGTYIYLAFAEFPMVSGGLAR